jgi:DNA-binding NarL/FixJ family response regulator
MGRNLSKVKGHGVFPSEIQGDPDTEALLRQLVQCVDEESAPNGLSQESGNTQEVVLDTHLDGMRYTLTRAPAQSSQPQVNLSPREKEIVRLVAKGHCNRSIAAVLDISRWTVGTHLRRIFAKLGVSCRAEMVARVLTEGLLGSIE